MAAITDNTRVLLSVEYADREAKWEAMKLAPSVTVFKHSFVCLAANGLLIDWDTDREPAGIARAGATSTATNTVLVDVAHDIRIKILVERGQTYSRIGANVFAKNNGTVTIDPESGSPSPIGYITNYDAVNNVHTVQLSAFPNFIS